MPGWQRGTVRQIIERCVYAWEQWQTFNAVNKLPKCLAVKKEEGQTYEPQASFKKEEESDGDYEDVKEEVKDEANDEDAPLIDLASIPS